MGCPSEEQSFDVWQRLDTCWQRQETCLAATRDMFGSEKRHVASPKHPNRPEAQLASYSVGTGSIFPVAEQSLGEADYRRTAISTGNTFQDLPRLRETADNTERYM
jgi:hypothetical protein